VSDRTPADREAARLERERRRAERQVSSESGEEGVADSPSNGADGNRVVQEAPSAGDTAGDGQTQEWQPGDWFDEDDEVRVDDARIGQHDSELPPGHAPDAGADPSAEAGAHDDDYEDDWDDEDDEIPVGTRRVAHSERVGATQPPSPRKNRREPRRRPRKGPVQRRHAVEFGKVKRKRKHSWAARLFGLLALVAVGLVIWFLVETFQPFHSTGHQRVTVVIPPHSSVGTVAKILAQDGVVPSGFFFEVRATLAGDRSNLRSGTYHLHQGMGYGDVLKVLTTAPPAAKTTDLTIVEGKTRRQVDALLRSQGVHGSYYADTRHSKLLNPSKYGAPHATNSLEGFLFPSTYQLRDPITTSALVDDQLKTFRQRFAKVSLGYARSKRMTPYDVLTIASMVQAEAETKHDRPLIASVIYNRLARGMPLQIDATTRYATGNYNKPLTVSQLNSSSPYNTRIHKGLPPTPIDSPGMASIQAAAHPAHTNYLYFVVKPCGNGEHAFASSYAQFQAEVAQYQTARTSRGGRSPEHC
jgi:peptidoglycan lytic transglycosylase G